MRKGLQPFLNEAFVVVNIFFALSGFLILHSYSKLEQVEQSWAQRPSWLWFYVKRFFRIFPAWLVILLISILYRPALDIKDFLWNLFFLFGFQPYHLNQLIAPHGWSLFVEEIFYLSFPLMALILKRSLLLPSLLIFLVLKFVFDYFQSPLPPDFQFHTPFNTFHFFAYGMLAYYAIPYLRKLRMPGGAFYLLLAAVISISALSTKHYNLLEMYVLFFFLFIFAGAKGFTKVFNFIFEKLGPYCYSFYLVHIIGMAEGGRISFWLLQSFQPLSPLETAVSVFWFSLLANLVFAYALYHLVEKPVILWTGRFIKKQQSKKYQSIVSTKA